MMSHSLITARDSGICAALVLGGTLLMIYQSNSVTICNSVIIIVSCQSLEVGRYCQLYLKEVCVSWIFLEQIHLVNSVWMVIAIFRVYTELIALYKFIWNAINHYQHYYMYVVINTTDHLLHTILTNRCPICESCKFSSRIQSDNCDRNSC